MRHIVSLSGGKDSTALALALIEREPRNYEYVCNPTGHELPDVVEHWDELEKRLGKPIIKIGCGRSLGDLIKFQNALPSWRMRWCTRMLKVEPMRLFLASASPCVSYVGLRADEPEEIRTGIFGDIDGVSFDYPLRRWGWNVDDVWAYLSAVGQRIPERTDCFDCYGQRLVEWKRLLERYPSLYALAEEYERLTGHTYRSDQRDSWPASLAALRVEFQKNRRVRGERIQLPLWEDVDDRFKKCRVCSL